MLDERTLLAGLNAMSRAHQSNYFTDGHRGAAIVSGHYLCRENDVEPGVADLIAQAVDRQWAQTPLCAPFPDQALAPSGVAQVAEALAQHIDGLRQAGHNVIFASLALKAFHDLPEAVTPARVDGICKLIASFPVTDVPLSPDRGIPDLGDRSRMAAFVLAELLKSIDAFRGRGQGWSGHLLTYSRALLDLRALGYGELARAAEAGYRLYIRRIRLGPQTTDKVWADHPPSSLRPDQLAYWQSRPPDWGLGHVLKYPYGYYGLARHVGDEALKARCLAAAYHIF